MMKITRETEEIVLLKEQEEEEEEEALSLCDLPNNEENQTKKEAAGSASDAQLEDFDFNSCGGNLLKESDMCTADEIFYQGQILPLRHSISLPSDRGNCCTSNDTNSSSRSSSIRSQRSSSSGSSSNFSTTCSKYKPKVRNQFHSHPSPTPQVRFSKVNTIQSNVNNSTRKSALWSLFRVGLVTTPEISLQDLKNRGNRDNSGSRNSTSSSSSNSLSNDDNRMKIILSMKKKQRFSLGSCKCSANAVETVLPSSVLIMNSNRTTITKTRKATEGHEHEDKKDSSENIKTTKKQAMSRHRTFEWLKQLSLEGPVDET
ncbi:hypothetical protein RND71_032980 [Anisodus tanguticus]|uniref:Uncharacterized protein n=1 Tax=Anisodus tanguticus TaxID=243964 RepID=A0AAE1R8E5_9SOLA|nr:hypothetical protein RND71_032980 [Anisodus tanguticus]